MTIKVLEKVQGCMPEIFKVGEWYDLRTAADIRLKCPHSKNLHKHKDGSFVEKFRDVVFDSALLPLGIAMQIPEGYEVQVRPRSGLAAKNGVTVLNSPGTIDSDYRGEIKVILINLGTADFTINSGDRIAQMVIAPVTQATFSITDSLSETERGAGGFGSTGVSKN